MNGRAAAPRTAALVGPYLSGKTTLLEALLFATGAINRRGTIKDGNTVGDASPEARARQMTTEINVAHTTYLGDPWTFLDCPGSVELAHETQSALLAVDVAVVVCEPEADRALTLSPLFKFLDAHSIPHMVFVNKLDTSETRVRDVMAALQSVSERPLVLRQVTLRDKEGGITGYVDLVSERAYQYKPGQASDLVKLPDGFWNEERATRTSLVEKLADYDDKLLEQLLEDVEPSKEEIYKHLAKDLQRDLIVPVMLGSGAQEHGVRRLLKALRHETPQPAATAARLGIKPEGGEAVAQVIKTYYPGNTGKLSLARVWRGTVSEGMSLNGVRVAGVLRMNGAKQEKVASAGLGEVVALARLEGIGTGTVLSSSGNPPALPKPALPKPVYALTVAAEKRADDVKLSGAIQKVIEEDPTLELRHSEDGHELVLWGQGDIHLQIALDRLRTKYSLPATTKHPQVGYRETIRRPVAQHARFKRQSGGHGQFADIEIEVRPLPRGSGHAFTNSVVGGAIPKNYIPAVEDGVNEYLVRGPLGFPVVDVAVNLVTGQFHAVDSSDQAFKTCGRMAMSEAMPKCDPVLLEPIHHVDISVPNAFTSKVQRLISGRRGQILGYDAKEGWTGWDTVSANLPQSELHDLIMELRSITLGVGTYTERFDRLQELTGKLAEKVMAGRAEAAAE
ncbi:MAG TPA: elongation factor G [Stellaceae bacterium]|jgi:elongation factor G|nr:elongation factor G [Stellaceae bacterium]